MYSDDDCNTYILYVVLVVNTADTGMIHSLVGTDFIHSLADTVVIHSLANRIYAQRKYVVQNPLVGGKEI